MSDAPLLLSSAKSAVLVPKTLEARLRLGALIVGAAVVLIGAADLSARAAHSVFGDNANAVAFAPAIAAVDPRVLATQSATTSGPMEPARLRIPSIGVNAAVEQVSVKADGTMGTPTKFGDVAWYAPGGKPGGEGNAVFAGHVNNALTSAGVFQHLDQVKVGDYITVADASGKTLVYKVISSKAQAVEDSPSAEVFAGTGPSRLVLITCAGEWVSSEHQYNERLVVIATPAY
jgi:sortase A